MGVVTMVSPCTLITIITIITTLTMVRAKTSTRQMTVEIEAGSDWCFFMPDLYEYQNMDFEFQVTDSSMQTGKNDITATITSPKPESRVIYHVVQEEEGSFSEELDKDGDYEICLDNTMSTWSDKVVWWRRWRRGHDRSGTDQEEASRPHRTSACLRTCGSSSCSSCGSAQPPLRQST